jgi:hypothetical protein
MPTYEQNKKHIYKWREQNREKHQRKRCCWKKIKTEFLHILII